MEQDLFKPVFVTEHDMGRHDILKLGTRSLEMIFQEKIIFFLFIWVFDKVDFIERLFLGFLREVCFYFSHKIIFRIF